DLFIGLGRGELLPYGSYYLTGFLHERPLARLRAHLEKLAIERTAGQAEPEDHAAILCEIMAGLTSTRFPAAAGSDTELFKLPPRWRIKRAPTARAMTRNERLATSRTRGRCKPSIGSTGIRAEGGSRADQENRTSGSSQHARRRAAMPR